MTIPRLIVLEGPDAAGKTTLAKHLACAIGASTYWCTWTPALNTAMADYQQNVIDNARWNIQELGRPMILDRHWPSEWVYGQVFRALDQAQIGWMCQFDAQIKDLGGVYVFCSDSTPVQRRRHAEKPDSRHVYSDHDYTRICGLYFEWWRRVMMTTPVYRYCITANGASLDSFTHDFLSDTMSRAYFPKSIRAITPGELCR